MSKNTETPMMAQFNAIKEQFPDSILFFRMGDFYEMFGEDAKVASKILGIALTARNKNAENQIPMCGIPHHSHKQYLLKLVTAGYKVAICEQLEDPELAKGLVKRGVTRVVSGGTIFDEEELPAADNNFLLAVYQDNSDGLFYISAADVSTGEVYIAKATNSNVSETINGFCPKEIVTSTPLKLNLNIPESCRPNLTAAKAQKAVADKYGLINAEQLGLGEPKFFIPLDMIFKYVDDAMLNITFTRPAVIAEEERLILDEIAVRTLDILDTPENKGYSVYSVLNHTSTAMGARQLRWWIMHPLRSKDAINHRLEAISFFVSEWAFTQEMEKLLSGVYDIERIANRIASKRVSAKELIWLRDSIAELPRIADMLEGTGHNIVAALSTDMKKCAAISILIEQSIVDEPPQNIKEGGIIKAGYNQLADELRDIKLNGRQKLASLEAELKTKTGINQLKIAYNKVFGYFIEVSKSNLGKVPDYFERKQTLVNAERFVTPELKELENLILNAEDKLSGLEYELFCSIRDTIAESADLLRTISKDIASLDCYISLARTAVVNSYCRPVILENGVMDVTDARHPVVEANSKELFIANNIYLNNSDSRLLIITGPNMAGKSTYIRSVAIIALMAHIGSFVPAVAASIPVMDRIFTRVGASDNISRGESTFMVEMVETANILTHATENSLIILDEIGRGTSTYDGLSIAWSVAEFILQRIKAKTLFATHYHELTEIAGTSGAKNYTISVKEQGGDIIFLRKIIEGSADKSYGIYVAKLAGLPAAVVKRAEEVLNDLESEDIKGSAIKGHAKTEVIVKPMLIFDEDHPVVKKLEETDINTLTPVDALNILHQLKKMI